MKVGQNEAWAAQTEGNGQGTVKASVGEKGGIFPQCQRLFLLHHSQQVPLDWGKFKMKQMKHKRDKDYNCICQKKPHYLPLVLPSGKEKPWHLVERKTKCIYLVWGSLAQILDLSPPRYHCDSFESEWHYFLSVSVFALSFCCGCGCFRLIFNRWLCQPSLSPCPE